MKSQRGAKTLLHDSAKGRRVFGQRGLHMNPYRFDVLFRVFHPKMDPDEISMQLGMTATRKWRAGDQRRTPKGQPLEGIYKSSYCFFTLAREKRGGLPELMEKFIKRVSRHKAFLATITSTKGRLELYISMFPTKNSGEILDWRMLDRLGKFKISLALDIYPSSAQSQRVMI